MNWLTKKSKPNWRSWGDYPPVVIINTIASIFTILTSIIPFIIILSSWWGQTIGQSKNLPELMTGEFNIAVAHFGQGTSNGLQEPEIADQISNLLFNFLDSEYNSINFGLKVQVSHKNILPIVEDIEAERIAKDINADVIIYGNVQIFGKNAEFFPRFYIADRSSKIELSRLGTTELVGVSRLESPIKFALADLGFQAPLNDELRKRTNLLISFTKGLTYFSGNKLQEAKKSFEESITEADSLGTIKGMEVLYLLLAMTNTQQENFEGSLKNLAESLKINPDYARGYIARGNIYYIQTINDWSQNKLDLAASEYQKALSAKDQPIGAYITEKASASLANIYVVQAQQTNNLFLYQEAIKYYNKAIRTFAITPNKITQTLAANAYFGLGVAYEKQKLLTQAYSSYQRSAELATENALASRAQTQIAILIDQNPSLSTKLNFTTTILVITQAAFGHLSAIFATNLIYFIAPFSELYLTVIKTKIIAFFHKDKKFGV